MTNENGGLSESIRLSFDSEHLAWDVARLGEGLEALARLMKASDPERTDGLVDVPILHGLGSLVEVVGGRFREYGERIEQTGHATRQAIRREEEAEGVDLREMSRQYAEVFK